MECGKINCGGGKDSKLGGKQENEPRIGSTTRTSLRASEVLMSPLLQHRFDSDASYTQPDRSLNVTMRASESKSDSRPSSVGLDNDMRTVGETSASPLTSVVKTELTQIEHEMEYDSRPTNTALLRTCSTTVEHSVKHATESNEYLNITKPTADATLEMLTTAKREHPDDDVSDCAEGTPSKRNKRKMTEPRRRTTDFSIRSICSNSDGEDSRETPRAELEPITDIASISRIVGSLEHYPFMAGLSGSYQLASIQRALVASSLAGAPRWYQPPRPSSADSVGSLSTPDGGLGFTHPTDNKDPPLQPLSVSFDRRDCPPGTLPPAPSSHGSSPDSPRSAYDDSPSRRARKNYKNMTKQRRVEANARERTRVHTISAAFESLRRAVPSYSYNQRLSKLAILRIACSYILALARLADLDYSEEQSEMSFGECVELCTQTIQAEGKAKRKH